MYIIKTAYFPQLKNINTNIITSLIHLILPISYHITLHNITSQITHMITDPQQQQKQTHINNSNIQKKIKNKFDSCLNYSTDKYNTYTFKKNNLFLSSNGIDYDDESDYIVIGNQDQDKIQKIQKNDIIRLENAQNLSDLWQMLGKDQQQSKTQTQENNLIKNKQQIKLVELTEEELIDCFGLSLEQNQQIQRQLQQKQRQEQINCKNIEVDEDLMEIWETENIEHNISLNSLQTTAIKIQKKNLLQHKTHKREQSQKFQIQDPNNISTKYFSTSTNPPAPTNNKQSKQQLVTTHVSSFNHPNHNYSQNPIKTQQQSSSSSTSQQNAKHAPYTLIIKQILNQNTHKGMNKIIINSMITSNAKQFLYCPFVMNSYSYMGVRQTKTSQVNKQQFSISYNLYSFQTTQQLVQCRHCALPKSFIEQLAVNRLVILPNGQQHSKKVFEYNSQYCYKFFIFSTQQHFATLFFKNKKQGMIYDLRMFDHNAQKHSESIALIEVEDGYANGICYCDIIVYMKRNKNVQMGKDQNSRKDKALFQYLKMILNTKNGKLYANMGINGIQSSPYNCCLENTNTKKFVYMMGLLKLNSSQSTQQFDNKSNFIIKVGEGLYPLLGLAICISRKLYIDSFD